MLLVFLRCPHPSRSRDGVRRYKAEPAPGSERPSRAVRAPVSLVSGVGPLLQSLHRLDASQCDALPSVSSAHKSDAFSTLTEHVPRTHCGRDLRSLRCDSKASTDLRSSPRFHHSRSVLTADLSNPSTWLFFIESRTFTSALKGSTVRLCQDLYYALWGHH